MRSAKPARIIPILFLAACAHAPPASPAPQIVVQPVAVACVPANLGPAPEGLETRESLAAIADPAERYLRLAADWARRAARMAATEPVIAGCRAARP